MRVFDYKFLILLALSLIVYFLYRELENLRNKVYNFTEKVDEMNDSVQIHNKAILLITDKKKSLKNKVLSPKKDNLVQLPLPQKLNNDVIEIPLPQLPSLVKSSPVLPTDEHIQINLPSMNNYDNDLMSIELPNSSCQLSTVDSDSYSNTSEHIDVYSNDDKITFETEEENKEVLVNFNVDYDKELIDESNEESPLVKEVTTISELMRNKLPELQELAEKLEISLLKDVNGKEKRKTKLELAEDILCKL